MVALTIEKSRSRRLGTSNECRTCSHRKSLTSGYLRSLSEPVSSFQNRANTVSSRSASTTLSSRLERFLVT
jgi:hypothetical protein